MTRYLKDKRVWIGIVLALCVGMIAAVGTAKAADKGKPKPVAAADSADSLPSWTGFGFDVHGSLATGTADWGAPVNLSMDGQMVGASAYYNHRFGVMVLGVDAGYDRVWGDLHAFGIDYAWTLGLRAGLLATNHTLVYARGEWLRAQGSGGHLDGYGIGAGIETRIAGTPASIALEYMHDWMDKDAFGPGVDVTSNRITTRLKFNLDRQVPNIFADR